MNRLTLSITLSSCTGFCDISWQDWFWIIVITVVCEYVQPGLTTAGLHDDTEALDDTDNVDTVAAAPGVLDDVVTQSRDYSCTRGVHNTSVQQNKSEIIQQKKFITFFSFLERA